MIDLHWNFSVGEVYVCGYGCDLEDACFFVYDFASRYRFMTYSMVRRVK
jgi:hypothetical protein